MKNMQIQDENVQIRLPKLCIYNLGDYWSDSLQNLNLVSLEALLSLVRADFAAVAPFSKYRRWKFDLECLRTQVKIQPNPYINPL